MAIMPIVGKPNCGKTLLMRALMQYTDYDDYYVNWRPTGIKNINYLRTVDDILDLPKDGRSKGIFIDEMRQMGADSWGYNRLADIMANWCLQHRKYVSDIIFTEQRLKQVLNRIRENAVIVMKPVDMIYDNGLPVMSYVKLIDFDEMDMPVVRNSFWMPLFTEDEKGHQKFACNLYDTHEFIVPMESVKETQGLKMRDKYKDFNLLAIKKNGTIVGDPDLKRDFISVLTEDEHIRKSDARDIANRMAYQQKVDLIKKSKGASKGKKITKKKRVK